MSNLPSLFICISFHTHIQPPDFPYLPLISRSANHMEVPANLLYTPPFVNPPHDSLLPQVNDRPRPSGGGVQRRKHSVEKERERRTMEREPSWREWSRRWCTATTMAALGCLAVASAA
ncbi:hypothetical protein Hanom_Chr01g00049081 [Helianthus anomalus]